MPANVRFRRQKTVEYSANNRVTEVLSRGMVYREIYLRLQGAPTLTAVNNTIANTQRGDEWGVVKKIEVIANGTDVIKSISGNDLWWLNYFLYGTPPRVTFGLGDASTVNPPIDSVLVLPFWMRDVVSPMDTALDSKNLASLEVAITWGDHADINSAATGFTVEPTIRLDSHEVFNVEGNFSSWRSFLSEKTIDATNAQFQIDLPIGNVFRGFMMNFTDADVDQGDILNTFKLISGTTVFADVTAQDDVLAQVAALTRGTPRVYTDGAGGGYTALRRATENAVAGWYYFDMVRDGLLTEAIDTLGLSELKLELDVTVGAGTTKARIIPIQIVPVRGSAPR